MKFNISVNELKELLKKEKINLIDVRTKLEYYMGHIKEAKSVPLSTIENYIPENKDEKIYVICKSGNRSSLAQSILLQKGYKVINVVGGMIEYKNIK